MVSKAGRTALGLAAGVMVLAVAVAIGWRLGTQAHGETATAPEAQESGPALPAASGAPDPFALLDCTARLFEDAPALSLTFTQPLSGDQDFTRLLRVRDLGAVPAQPDSTSRTGDQDESDVSANANAAPSRDDSAAGSPVDGAWVRGENPRVLHFPYAKPLRRYAVAIDAGLRAADGAQLPKPAECRVDSQAMPPAFYFASRGVVLPTAQNGGLPIVTVNVPEVDVEFLRIAPAQLPAFYDNILGIRRGAQDDAGADNAPYHQGSSLQGNVGLWDLDRLNALTQSVFRGRFLAGAQPDRRHLGFLPVEDIEALRQPGVYVAVMSEPGRFRYEYQVTYFYVSDIGLHTRRHPEHIDAFATSLKTAQALSDVTFELLDAQGKLLASEAADEHGHAHFAGRFASARLLLARRGSELTLVALQQTALDLSEFDAGGYPSRNTRLFAYAGRDLYRPGETYPLSVLIRDADGAPLVARSPLSATLKRPDTRIVRTELWPVSAEQPGYVKHDVALPADAPTGTWTLELRVDPASPQPDASWRFQVEEFLPERMKLRLTPSATSLLPDETLSIDAQGDYLFGAPAAGNRLLGSLRIERQREALPQQWPGFIFGDVADDDRRQWHELPERSLDAGGAAHVDIPLELGNVHSPMRVTGSFSLLETGGRPVVRSADASVWPAPALIGVRPLFANDVAREGALAQFETARVDRNGVLAPLAQAQLRLYREQREYYWRFDDQSGWNSGFIETEELVESRSLDLSERTTIGVPVQWGRYRLELSDPELGQTLRYRFYAGWAAQDAEAMGNRPDRVQMKLTPETVRPGDTVSVLMTPPHDGEAIVTVEADQVLWSRRLPVRAGGTRLDIPLDAAWQRHDLYVTAVVFRPGAQAEARVTPARAVGLVHLPLDRTERRLDLAIEAPASTRPETRTAIRLKIDPPPADDAVWATLSAVDTGILNISRYRTPDAFDFFFGQQRYDAEMLDMYGRLIEKMRGTQSRLKWGGDAAARNAPPLPPRVQLTDLFQGPVKFDANGEASIVLTLPDFNGALRLMATAFTPTRFGSAEHDMVVAAPVVAEIAQPRFMTPGDTATLVLDVTNLSGQPQNLQVNLLAHDPITIEDGQRTLTLADGEHRALRFNAIATGSPGDALLTLKVTSDTGPDAIDISRRSVLAVQPARFAQRETLRQRLAPGATFRLPAERLAAYLTDTLTIGIAASGQPPFHIGRLASELLDYPYGCTEQTASAAYPLLLIDDALQESAGMTSLTSQQRRTRMESAIARLAGNQKTNGSFSLWDNGPPDVWLTAYTTLFLQDARSAGYAVPDDIFKRANAWLLERLRETPDRFPALPETLATHRSADAYSNADYALLRDSHRRFAGLALAGYALAREQQAPLASLRQLHDLADRARSPLPLAHLAAALRLMGDEPRAKESLAAAMARPYGIDAARAAYGEWLGDYGSAIRDYALTYVLLRRHQFEHEREALLLQDVATQLAGRQWLSTQEQFALLQAGTVAGGKEGAQWALTVRDAGKSRELAHNTVRAVTLSGGEASVLTLHNPSDTPVFVALDIHGFTRLPDAASDAGARLERRWYLPDGTPWQGGELETGDTLIVGLTASADQRIENALIVDRIPAGFEVDNLNLSQGSTLYDMELDGVRIADAMNDGRVTHREYRDDRYVASGRIDQPLTLFYRVHVINPGRYAVPQGVVEDMYRPEIRGTSPVMPPIVITDPRGQ